MSSDFLEQFVFQTPIAVHVTMRDTVKRLTTLMLIMTVCAVFISESQAFFWSGCAVVTELVVRAVNLRIKLNDPQMTLKACLLVWALNTCLIIPLVAPGIMLVSHGSDALQIAGFMWLFGLCVAISNTYAGLPFYNWSLMVPAFGAAFWMFWVAANVAPVQSGTGEWLTALGLLVVYVANTFQTMSNQRHVMFELSQARRDADKRLSELEFLNQHDPLTGLKNRPAFEKAATNLLPRRRNRDKGHLAYYLLDLDGFKPINDSYSHKAGDAVLVAVADRLMRFVGDRGVVGRLGGDEFAVAIPNFETAASALQFGQELAAVVKVPVTFDHKQLSVGTSVGVALSQTHHDSLAQLASGADQAMFQAKQDPGREAILFDRRAFPERASLDDRAMIVRAMQKNHISPFYQPKVCLKTGRTKGFEALSRWQHPARGLLLPGKFLPFINELGLQNDFLMHTTTRVLQQITELVGHGLDPGQVSVNVPEVTLATLSGRAAVLSLLEQYPEAVPHLTFEVTEDVFIARSGNLIQESIAIFRKAGVRVSLDDFGTGFASFKHLRELEFDEIKLDTSFVRGLGVDPAADVLVRGFLFIGHGLGVQVIAEGVETAAQRDILRNMGCHCAQGFFYSKAVPFADARRRLVRELIGELAAPAA